ncbi:glycosyltransferase [Microbacterium marinilacus]|uniref:Glycosyltransferase 2-like domain-containing protein n=1 Tax=Microbacterium marinilacus TaxID=415209 RepID=A0ABP7BMM5_9MICO|nr:glycosyltransferase family A protein [Microbacterium marinilacus]MBY0690046.1 glycosyltransferase family 2 protein [Microbacterium marinilacus]
MTPAVSMGPATPAMSVVIPAYDAEATLGEQLAALAGQDAEVPFEVLVCDNGSTDGTAELVRAAALTWPWLRLVDASGRRGASAARNIGAAAARAPVLLFCDADDVVSPGWVRAFDEALRGAAFAAGAVEHARLNGGRDWDFGWDRPTFVNPALPQLRAGGSGNMAIRADAFAAVGGFDELLFAAEDIDFSWRVQLAGHALVEAPAAIVHVRKRAGLGAALRQAYAKGAGARVLSHRYAAIREALEREAAPDPATDPELRAAGGRGRARLRRLPGGVAAILRAPARATVHLAALAYRAGYRRARVDGVVQLAPAAALPSTR